jgi:tetratricopeptide (TPR) repeat protein
VSKFFYLFILLVFFSASSLVAQQSHESIDFAIQLFNKGKHDKAQQILTDNLSKNPEDVDSRLILGVMALHLGKDDKALDVWETGLKKNDEDFPLLINIAKLHLKHANDLAAPVSNTNSEESENEYKKNKYEHLDKALESYRQASELYPYQAEPLEEVANIHDLKEEYKSSLFYWTRLKEMFPEQENYYVKVGESHLLMEDMETALTFFDKAIEINPSYELAYKGKAKCLTSLSSDSLLIQNTRHQAKYYKWIPDFMDLPYTEKLYKRVNIIAQKKSQRRGLMFDLIKENTLESKKLLALSLWYGNIPKVVEKSIFKTLTAKKKEEDLYLLIEMLQNTEKKFLASKLMLELAKAKPAGTFNLLLPFLDWSHPLQPLPIAEALVVLGDNRAIPYLIREIEVEHIDASQNMQAMFAVFHKQKAALALSNFDVPLTVEYLQKGLKNPNIARHCAASLYRLSGDETYLKMLKKLTKKIDKDFLLAEFLYEEIGDKASIKLANKLE